MARLFTSAPEYADLRDEVESRLTELVDGLDPEAILYVHLTGLGRIQVIVVSDVLAGQFGLHGEEQLWEKLRPRLSNAASECITVFQLLDTVRALRLHGPVDVARLARIGAEQLVPEWEMLEQHLGSTYDRESPAQGDQLMGTLRLTVDWLRSCEIVMRTQSINELDAHLQTVRRFVEAAEMPPDGSSLVIEPVATGIRAVVSDLRARPNGRVDG